MKKSTKIIIAVVAVIIVAAAVVATLFLTGVIGKKNPKEGFIANLDRLAAGEGEFSYSDAISNLKNYKDKSYEGKGKMSMNIELGSTLSDDEVDSILEILNNAEISYERKVDPKNSRQYTMANIKYDGEDLGKAEVIVDGDKIGGKIEDITDKYLTVTVDELMEALDLDSVDISTDEIDMDKLIEILDISNDELNRIKDRYKKVLEDEIPEEKYSSEKEKITVNGKEINATAYSVEITQKDLAKVIEAVLKSLKDDDDTINLIVDKYNAVMDFAGETSEKLTKSDIEDFIEYGLDNFENDLVDIDDEEKMKITLYEYKDQVARIEISISDDAIIIDSLKDGDVTNMQFKLNDSGKEMTILNIEYKKLGDNKYSIRLYTDIEGIKFEITMEEESTDSNSKANMKFYAEIPSMLKATINMEAEVEYKSVSINALSSSNSISAMNLTTSDQQELAKGLLNYVDNHMDVIKDIAGKMGYEDEIEELEQQINQFKAQTTQTTTTPNDVVDDAA